MRLVIVLCFLASSSVAGQIASPRGSHGGLTSPTPATRGAPPPSDSLYRLAVKPSDHPDESVVWLLDEGVLRLEPDGRGTRTYRQVVEILKEDAAERYQERQFSYSPGHEKMTVNWIRVVKPNGEVISAQPSQIQDSDIPASMGDPVYSDRKVRRVSLTGVEPGSIVDYSYTTEELKPYLPGDFYASWAVNTPTRTMRSNYQIDVPESFNLRIREQNPRFPRTVVTRNGRKVYSWTAGNLDREKIEAFAADSGGVFQSVEIGGAITWSDIAKWYADNARSRYTVTPNVAAKIAQVVAGSKTRDDSVRAIHRWVAQDIRYVSIALGMGGYQPRAPETVVETGFGDCKDKTTLFVAALGKIGVTALPVILSSDGNPKRDLPTISQFDHAIAAVQKADGYQFVDLTASLVPYGQLPASEQGGFALVVHPDGRAEEVILPIDPASANREDLKISGRLGEDGMFNGRYDATAQGSTSELLRTLFENPLDSTQRADFPKELARKFFDSADADSLAIFNGKDLSITPRLSFRIRNAKAAVDAGGTRILTIPVGSMSAMATMGAALAKEPTRRFPIDASKIIGPRVSATTVSIILPKGWKAKLPPNVSASSSFGSYVSEYSQVGDELRISRTISGTRGIFPPDRINDLITWLQAIGKDDSKFIVLEKSGA
ncbi:MAG TPA: DUF3857 domain-containing transglutaminase family protein [Gemmatimonadaceae bacterium]|nr:DUF3857 domain-containing transglutaminase family protein [Gemmatimonadaceae bacterium]